MCGKLQCENVLTSVIFGIKPSIIQTPIAGTTCWGVDFLLGSDVPDPGMVNEGTKCGENKVTTKLNVLNSAKYCLCTHLSLLDLFFVLQVCLNYECKSTDVLNYDCDVEKKCHGHGVHKHTQPTILQLSATPFSTNLLTFVCVSATGV